MELLFLLIAFGAEIVGTMTGFGASTVALPLSLFVFDFKTAVVLVAFLHIFGNTSRLWFFGAQWDKKVFLKFGIPSVLFTAAGAFLIAYVPQETLKGVLGLFLLIYAAYSWRGESKLKPSTATALTGGIVSGFFAGLIGTGGALRGAFLNAFTLPKETYLGTAAAIAIAVDLTRIPLYLRQGFLPSELYWLLPVTFLVAFTGSFTGKQIVKRVSQKTFTRIVLIALALVGLKFISDWLF